MDKHLDEVKGKIAMVASPSTVYPHLDLLTMPGAVPYVYSTHPV